MIEEEEEDKLSFFLLERCRGVYIEVFPRRKAVLDPPVIAK
jgi:hypothetical protein